MPGFSEVGLRNVPLRLGRFRLFSPPRLGGIVLVATFFASFCIPPATQGQVISPGELSEAHQDLTGIGNCTRCHQLRSRGIDPSRCLECHGALGDRMESGEGYHGRLEEGDCGVCHKEHLGADFALIRMDPDTFSHGSTGYVLEGAHTEVGCRECHLPERIQDPAVLEEHSASGTLDRTYLGLARLCGSCHHVDDPHEGQFTGQDCGECHEQDIWEGAAEFDHDRSAYPLEGRHREVECGGCHIVEQPEEGPGSIRYKPLEARDCSSCHDDAHQGRMPGRCATCHSPSDWGQVDRRAVEVVFDHSTTEFPLVGAHARAGCSECHSPGRVPDSEIHLTFLEGAGRGGYPEPVFTSCGSCHVDAHQGVFDQPACDGCHTSESWVPPDYSLARHRMERRFPLSGAHAVTPCSACHETREGGVRSLVFRFEAPDICRVCHSADDPHGEAFRVEGCDLCHGDADFQMGSFEHERLEQAGWRGFCTDCHEDVDPHGDQFPDRDCSRCHETDGFDIPDFDHSGTRFPLEGAHEQVTCFGCHGVEPGPGGALMVRYRPLETDCSACHGGGR